LVGSSSPIWCGRHSGICEDHVESFALHQQPIGAGTYALEVGKIELNQIETSTIGRRVLSHLGGRRFGLS